MMNLVAIGLVLTTLTVSGLFSPTPYKINNGGEQVIVKNGHRAVVVEYADVSGDGNTKVSISPKQSQLDPLPIEEQLSRAAASVAGVAQDTKGKPHVGAGPKELICDAYGKCKERVVGVLSKAKEKVEDGAQEVRENVKEKVSETGEVVGGGVDKAKDLASRASKNVEQSAENVRDNAKETVKKTGEVMGETKEMIKEKGEKGKKELKEIVERGKEVMFDVVRYMFDSMSSLMGVIHLLGLAMAYGISVWVSFIMSHVLGGVLPRQQFGMVQSKMYPVYFKAMVASIGLALVGHMLGHSKSKANWLQACNLLGSMLSVLVNLLFLEPKATKVMFQRMKLEKEEGRGRESTTVPSRTVDTVVTDAAGLTTTTATTTATTAAKRTATREQVSANTEIAKLDERLKKLNSYSSLLNISTLIGLTWHLVYLSQCLQLDSS